MKEMISKQICSSGLSRFVPLNKGALHNTERSGLAVLNGGKSVRSVSSSPSSRAGRVLDACLRTLLLLLDVCFCRVRRRPAPVRLIPCVMKRDKPPAGSKRAASAQRSRAPRNQAVTMVTFLKPAPWGDGIRLCVYFNRKVLK